MSEVIDSASLRRDLMDAGHKLQAAIDEAREASVEYVRVKYEKELAWDKAFLAADGTEQTKKSKANIATAELTRIHDLALERKRNAKLQVEAFQAIVSALQTVGSTARAEMRLAGYPS